jgi:hypothetical protein
MTVLMSRMTSSFLCKADCAKSKESLMNSKLKRITVATICGALAIAVAFGAASTTFAQDPGPEQQPNTGVARPGRFGERLGAHGPGGWGMRGGSLATIAGALEISEADLLTALRSGQSIAEVAEAQGVDLNVVTAALVAEQGELLAQAVTDGRLTQEEADERLANFEEKLPELLERAGVPGGPGRGFGGLGGFGFGGPGASLATLAGVLEISEADLHAALRSGQSIAEMLKSPPNRRLNWTPLWRRWSPN